MVPKIKLKAEAKVQADLTKPIEELTEEVILPPAKETSKGITRFLELVNTAFDNATYKYIENSKYEKTKFMKGLSKKYEELNEKDIVEPDISILGNTLDTLKYVLDKEYLVEMYTNILISDVDKNTKDSVHISFVEILKQLNKNDLEVLKAIYEMKDSSNIAFGKLILIDSDGRDADYSLHIPVFIAGIDNYGINDYNAFSKSIENLSRLGLINITYMNYFSEKEIYEELIKKVRPSCEDTLRNIERYDKKVDISCEKGLLSISNLGYDMMKVCLREK